MDRALVKGWIWPAMFLDQRFHAGFGYLAAVACRGCRFSAALWFGGKAGEAAAGCAGSASFDGPFEDFKPHGAIFFSGHRVECPPGFWRVGERLRAVGEAFVRREWFGGAG